MTAKIFVVPNGKNWSVKKAGVTTPVSNHRTQKAALESGRPIAKKLQTELVTLDRHGKIRDSDSFGKDPKSIKDKRH